MKVLIKIPTKFRKKKFFSTLNKFYELIEDLENTFFLITLDNDDFVMNTDVVRDKLDTYKNLEYYFGEPTSKLFATNRDLEKYTEWHIMILASDDTIPIKKGFDNIVREKMKEYYPDLDGVLHFNDGHQKSNLNTLPILGKKYFDRFGYVQYPEYKSTYADVEFMDVAKILNKVIYFDDVIIEHQHPDWGYGQRDYAHIENHKNLAFDSNLYNERKQKNFDLIN
jgi:hypothetical protein